MLVKVVIPEITCLLPIIRAHLTVPVDIIKTLDLCAPLVQMNARYVLRL